MKDCLFCKIINGEIPSRKIYEDEEIIAFMDINPVVDGHILVIPKQHATDFTELNKKQLLRIHQVAKDLTKHLMNKLKSKGLTLSVNYGKSQQVKHFHLHLLPDYGFKKKNKSLDEIYEIIKND